MWKPRRKRTPQPGDKVRAEFHADGKVVDVWGTVYTNYRGPEGHVNLKFSTKRLKKFVYVKPELIENEGKNWYVLLRRY